MEEKNGGIERVVERLHEEEIPLCRCDTRVYSAKAREFFPQIRKMRLEGFSYIQISRAFEREELLPENSRVSSFRQACRREFVRREREVALSAMLKEGTGQTPRKLVPNERQGTVVTKTDDVDDAERRKKLGLGRRINTGNGTIIKNTDGSFDYD